MKLLIDSQATSSLHLKTCFYNADTTGENKLYSMHFFFELSSFIVIDNTTMLPEIIFANNKCQQRQTQRESNILIDFQQQPMMSYD
jgi:hypothetical protein